MTSTLHDYQGTFLYCLVLLRMRNVSDTSCREYQNFSNFFGVFFVFWNRAICGKMWKNIVELDRPWVTLWHIRIA
jgi:hypothetical protein